MSDMDLLSKVIEFFKANPYALVIVAIYVCWQLSQLLITLLQTRNTAVKLAVTELKRTLDDLRTRVTTLESSNSELVKQNNAKETRIDELERSNSEKDESIRNLTAKLFQQNIIIQTLNERISRLVNRLKVYEPDVHDDVEPGPFNVTTPPVIMGDVKEL